jgi:rhodanese-related sulfurtransferase
MKKMIIPIAAVLSVLILASCAAKAYEPDVSETQTVEMESVEAEAAETETVGTESDETESTQTEVEYRKITAEQAKERIDSGDELIVLDVRTQDEYDAGHIEGALLLPNETIFDMQPDLLPDLDAEILIYCRSGNRSAQAALKLIAMGYTNVYDFGGIIDWPYDIVTD